MKKKILYLILFIFLIIIPIEVFGQELYDYTDNSYNVKVKNQEGAKVYVSLNGCIDCGYYDAFIIKEGTLVSVNKEYYDYNNVVNESSNYVAYLNINLEETQYDNNEEEYSRLLNDAKEKMGVSEKNLLKNISKFLINSNDVELDGSINKNDDRIIEVPEKLLSMGSSNPTLYSEPTILSSKLATISSGVLFKNIKETYSDSWYKVEYNNNIGWINTNLTDSFYYFKPSNKVIESLTNTEESFKNIQFNAEVSITKNRKTYVFPKDIVFDEFYYNIINEKISKNISKIAIEYNNEFFEFDENQFNKCTQDSCEKNDLKVIVDGNNIKDETNTNMILAIISIIISIIVLIVIIVILTKRKKK